MSARFVMAVVVTGSPLTVTIEGASAVVAAEDFVGGLATGDRVQAAFLGDRLVVFAKAGGNRPGRNVARNGRFRTNQRGYVSGTDLALGAYGIDGWKASTALSRMTFTASPQGQQVTIAAGDSFSAPVERANIEAGPWTVSWVGTSQGRVYNVGASAPSYAASPITVTLDGLADVIKEFGPGTLDYVQLERGTVATPYRSPAYDDELHACMRYYQRRTGPDGAHVAFGWVDNSTRARFELDLPVPMRAYPTGTGTGLKVYDGSTAFVISAIEMIDSTLSHLAIKATISGGTAGKPCYMFLNTASDYLAFDSEM